MSLFYPFVNGGFISCLRLMWESIKLSNQWTAGFYMCENSYVPHFRYTRGKQNLYKASFCHVLLASQNKVLIVTYSRAGLAECIGQQHRLGILPLLELMLLRTRLAPLHQVWHLYLKTILLIHFLNQKMYSRGLLTCFS